MKTISLHPDRTIALLSSVSFALLLFCFLMLYKIKEIRITTTATPAPTVYIALSGFSGGGGATSPIVEDNTIKTSLAPASSVLHAKEQEAPSGNALFSHYKNSYTNSTSPIAPGTGEELNDSKSPFFGKEMGSKPGSPGDKVQLSGRKVLHLAGSSDTKESGIVVVNIVVDKSGKVIGAEANGRGTNTSSVVLKSKACQAAFNSAFSASETEEAQRGTITYVFEF